MTEKNRTEQKILQSQPSIDGIQEFFTGKVKITPLFQESDNMAFSVAYVSFDAGARTAWHTHPCGQRLICTEGKGLTAEWNGKVEEFQAGDVIVCPENTKYWHGATLDSSMTHIAITGVKNGKAVEWLEKVTDIDYQKHS